jgi:hypothetical protein
MQNQTTTASEADRTRKMLGQNGELQALAKRFRVSRESLERAVNAVGNNVPDVERYLERYLYEGCA